MKEEARLETIEHTPPRDQRRKFLLKKGLSLIGFGLMGGFLTWYAWPGIAGPPVPLDPGYWTFLAGLFLGVVALGVLFVVTWIERLPRIHNGVVDLPFPLQRINQSRTNKVRIDEILSIELTTIPGGRPGAELILLDRTRFFLPDTVFGAAGKRVLETLAQHVSKRLSKL